MDLTVAVHGNDKTVSELDDRLTVIVQSEQHRKK